MELFDFIQEALRESESVLIHSVRGQSRSCCVLIAFMMKKYSWSLRKTMEFLMARRPDISLKATFLQQLSQFERRLINFGSERLTTDWSDTPLRNQHPIECEELILRNTFINSQLLISRDAANFPNKRADPRLMWGDGFSDDKKSLERVCGDSRPHNKRNSSGQIVVKGILKQRRTGSRTDQTIQSRPTTASSEREYLSKGYSKEDFIATELGEPKTAWVEDDGLVRTSYSRQRMPSPSNKGDSYSSVREDSTGRAINNSRTVKASADRSDTSAGGPIHVRSDLPKHERDKMYNSRPDSPLRLSKNQTARQSITKSSSFGASGMRQSSTFSQSATGSRLSTNPGSAMSAYRSGPVRARMDINSAEFRKQRPASAPMMRPNPRPSSPFSMNKQSNSRPPSPNTRPPGTMTKNYTPISYQAMLDKNDPYRIRSFSAQIRRAPSPTPAFNRATSPSRPRWRM